MGTWLIETPEPAEPTQANPKIWLDQWVWIELTRGRLNDEHPYGSLYRELSECVADSRLDIVLSSTNYLEVFNKSNPASRARIALTMANLSKYKAIAPLGLLQAEETLEAARTSSSAEPVFLPSETVFASGVNHAFHSATGRWRFVESIATEDAPEGAAINFTVEWNEREAPLNIAQREWAHLVGFNLDHERLGLDFRPSHRLGNEFTKSSAHRQAWIDRANSDESLRYRSLVLDQLHALRADILAGFEDIRSVNDFFTGPIAGVSFIGRIPTVNAQIELTFRAERNRSYQFKQHDAFDISAAAQTLPYCSAVWLDKHWTHIARAGGVAEMFGTHLISGVADFRNLIKDL